MPLSTCGERVRLATPLSLSWIFPRPSESALLLDLEIGDTYVLGRDERCSTRLCGPDISRRHARLTRDGPHLVLTDLGSRNGTFVNGRPVQSAHIGEHDIIRFGAQIAVLTARPGPTQELGPGLLAGPELRAQLDPLMRVASSDLPVILEGETGTGKEIVARSLHTWSGRAGPFGAVNCAALPESLAEAELFGYRRGAFTGANRDSPGIFRGAEGGTLLLDEVSDLPLSLQPKLLRVLEQREVQPLGETRPIPIDVRIVVATQESLSQAVQQKRFRQDLLARLNGIHVELPPLRRRRSDVIPLLSRALAKFKTGVTPTFNADFVETLCIYDWPFNVRELVLLAKRLSALHDRDTCLRAAHLPADFLDRTAHSEESLKDPPQHADDPATRLVELPSLIAALRASQGNIAQASAMLGISRQRAYRLMQGHAVDLEALRKPTGARQ